VPVLGALLPPESGIHPNALLSQLHLASGDHASRQRVSADTEPTRAGVLPRIDDYALFLADLELGMAWARQRGPTTPLFLFGQSVGAALALALATRLSRLGGMWT
jgi:alpha-beta hydrolase superfamily lysophospholipase